MGGSCVQSEAEEKKRRKRATSGRDSGHARHTNETQNNKEVAYAHEHVNTHDAQAYEAPTQLRQTCVPPTCVQCEANNEKGGVWKRDSHKYGKEKQQQQIMGQVEQAPKRIPYLSPFACLRSRFTDASCRPPCTSPIRADTHVWCLGVFARVCVPMGR